MVYFKVGNETRKYKMTSIRDVKPTDVEVLDEQKGKDKQLTLITCDDYNEKTGVWEKRKNVCSYRSQIIYYANG